MAHVASDEFIVVQTRGGVSEAEAEYARSRVGSALHHASEPVLYVRVKLTRLPDPAVARPAVAQVNVDLNGRLVRAQAARSTIQEAVDEVHDRLRDRVLQSDRGWESVRGARPSGETHEWRHQSEPTERPPYFSRPVEDREIVRHKAFGLDRMTVDEAVEEMTTLDYGFHLFTESGSGIDSVVYRTHDPIEVHLAQVRPRPDLVPVTTAVVVDPRPVPRLTMAEAAERLEATGAEFVFFMDAASDRGCLLYHRYDGHYGLITPAG